MRVIVGVGLALALACGAAAEDKKDETIDAKKLIGKWKQIEPKDGPQVTIELTADGKVLVLAEIDGKKLTGGGTYKLDGNKIVTVTKPDGEDEEVTGGGTITKLTDDVLEMTDTNAIELKLKRVPKK